MLAYFYTIFAVPTAMLHPTFAGGRPAYGKDSFLVLRISRDSAQTAYI